MLLTSKEPEPSKRATSVPLSTTTHSVTKADSPVDDGGEDDNDEEQALHDRNQRSETGERILWQLGDASDDEDRPVADGAHRHVSRGMGLSQDGKKGHEESALLMQDEEIRQHRRSNSSDATLGANDETREADSEFGPWKDFRS